MLDLRGSEILPEEREMLLHPLVGGVILFTRNYESPEQVAELVKGIHEMREPSLLVAVDHEGGTVQRFRDGFTQLPACAVVGKAFEADERQGVKLAEDCGWLMAAELRAVGVDFSFAPVLDLCTPVSRVIGERAFHHDPETIARLAQAYMYGMRAAGMCAVGKHFPGHGSVAADSHHEPPVDERAFDVLEAQDMVPFRHTIAAGLEAIMPAHVIYPQVHEQPAGFSSVWLQEILRRQLGFQGAIVSDDISMAGAAVVGDHIDRARAALGAGCDMVLVCNDPDAAVQLLDGLGTWEEPVSQARLMRMQGRPAPVRAELKQHARWARVSGDIKALACDPGARDVR